MKTAMVVFGSFVASVLAVTIQESPDTLQEDATSKQESAAVGNSRENPFEPIDDMHHFMEYVVQPAYQSLRKSMAEEPADRRGWRPIRQSAILLGETSVIVWMRVPDGLDDTRAGLWKEISLDVHKSGKALYDAGTDFARARECYEKLIDNCNRCHKEFENGRHMLEK